MNTNIITPPKYQNVSRKGYMTKIENDLISHFEAKGAHDGKNNMPETETEYQAMVVNDIQTTMQHEINLNYQEPMPGSAKIQVAAISHTADKETKILEAKKFDLEKTKNIQKRKLDSYSHQTVWRWVLYCIYGFLGIMGITEGWLAYPAFRSMPLPTAAAIAASTGVFFLVSVIGHHSAVYIKHSVALFQKRIRYISIMGLYVAGFCVIAIIRAKSYNEVYDPTVVGSPTSFNIPAWCIALISSLMFWGCLALSIWTTPTKEEKQLEDEHTKAKDALQSTTSEIAALEAHIKAIDLERKTKIVEIMGDYESAISNERILTSLADKLLQKYNGKNMLYRSNEVPHFFAIPFAFSFTTYFNSLQNNQQ